MFVERGRAYQGHGVTCYRHSIGELEPRGVADRIAELAELSDGLAVSLVEHPSVRHAARKAIASGTPLVTLANDLEEPHRLAYVGIDNRMAGRTAAYLIGRFVGQRGGIVAIVAGTLSYLSLEQRVSGFRAALGERFPNRGVTEVMLGYDDIDLTYDRARQALQIPDLVAVYNAGAGNRGIAQALRDTGRGEEIVFIGHELTDHSRRFLEDGVMDAVIDQNMRGQATRALDLLLDYHGVPGRPLGRELLPIEVVLPENIPPSGHLRSPAKRRR